MEHTEKDLVKLLFPSNSIPTKIINICDTNSVFNGNIQHSCAFSSPEIYYATMLFVSQGNHRHSDFQQKETAVIVSNLSLYVCVCERQRREKETETERQRDKQLLVNI